MRDDDFEPRLGRIGNRIAPRQRTYLQRVTQAIALAGGVKKGPRSTFTGERIGRGSGIGRILSARGDQAKMRVRRVIIKSRVVKLAGKARANALAHLRYVLDHWTELPDA